MLIPGFVRTDGVRNGLQIWAVTHLGALWRFLQRTALLRSGANRLIIDQMVYKMKTRPDRLSTMSPYASWPSLTNRTFSDRHLPPDPALQIRLPAVESATALFLRTDPEEHWSEKSTLLFPHFAQWFTDGFLRTDPTNPLKNTSTHDIDLSQLYGQTEDITTILRTRSGGRLKSQTINGAEYPPYYFDDNGDVKPEFADLPITVPGGDRKAGAVQDLTDLPSRKFFALGIPRGNIHYGFAMISTLFLREHNRLADAIAAENTSWEDERIFQTARDTMIVLLLKVVVEDYINHITPYYFKLFVEPRVGTWERWYRQNWMSIEFNMLYRWHALVPTRIRVGGQARDMADVLWDNNVVVSNPLGALFEEASRQPSTDIGLLNTSAFLLDIERRTIEMGRTAALASYNDYREACGYPRMQSVGDISSNAAVRAALTSCYRSVDDIELYVGLFAEDVRTDAALPTLMGTMVGVDAFSQALTNPLLADGIFEESTFSRSGWRAIGATGRLQDILDRNVEGGTGRPLASLTQLTWSRR
jgi:prostaglandin-endoperoxide synthase 2